MDSPSTRSALISEISRCGEMPRILGVREVTSPKHARWDFKYICNFEYGGNPIGVQNCLNLPRQSTLVRIVHFGAAFHGVHLS